MSHTSESASLSLFDLVFRGQLAPGATLEQTQHNMAQLFKMPPDKVATLFRGGAVTLKKGLEKDAALKYQSAIAKAGAVVELVEAKLAPPAEPAAPVNNASLEPVVASETALSTLKELATKEPAAKDQTIEEPTWSLRQLGDDLLAGSEKNQQTSRLHEFADFDLRAAAGNLLDVGELKPLQAIEIPPVNFGLAPAGADVLAPAERAPAMAPSVQPGNWQVAPVGERLSAIKTSQPLPPNVDHLTLQK